MSGPFKMKGFSGFGNSPVKQDGMYQKGKKLTGKGFEEDYDREEHKKKEKEGWEYSKQKIKNIANIIKRRIRKKLKY